MSLPKAGLPPEIADAIEFTAEFRHAMGFFEDTPDPDPIIEVPSKEELAQIPEWYAVNARITAEEYLACFGYSETPIQRIKHGLAGKSKPWKARKKRDSVE
jgi:hypothetical protein